jgi:hypothetical protein
MEVLFVLFVIVVGWLFLTHYILYAHTGAWYHLLILLGAALSFSYFFARSRWDLAGLLILLGSILLSAGVVSILTFGANRELERLRASSWKDILFGGVPQHLRTGSIDRRNGILLCSLSLLFAFVLFKGGHVSGALNLAVIGVVAALYSFWRTRRKTKGE